MERRIDTRVSPGYMKKLCSTTREKTVSYLSGIKIVHYVTFMYSLTIDNIVTEIVKISFKTRVVPQRLIWVRQFILEKIPVSRQFIRYYRYNPFEEYIKSLLNIGFGRRVMAHGEILGIFSNNIHGGQKGKTI